MANDKFETTYFDPKEVRRRSSQRPRKKRRKNAGLRVAIYLVSVVLVSTLLAGFGWMLANDLCAFNKPYKEATIVVTRDDSVSDVAKKLKKEGLINYKGFFKFVGKFMHASSKIDPGEYVLNTDMDYRSLIANMHDYEEDRREAEGLVRITIPEGLTVRQIIDLLAENGVATVEELEDACANYEFKDYDFLREDMLGQINRMEGFLFPDTYDFNPNKSAVYAIDTLLTGFVAKIDAEIANAIANSGYDLRQIITMASIIEKEGIGDVEERKNIASVLYNRMSTKDRETYGYLQLDTTVYYALSLEGKDKTAFSTELDSPYNTYLHQGLPIGPICNPGMSSIAAAIYPNHTDYFYFAAGKDGVNHFFTNYNDHINFVNSDMYQPD
jgi:UPF0755 protein